MSLMTSLLMLFFFQAQAAPEIPTQPPNPCYEKCTPQMQGILDRFQEISTSPTLVPSVYSGNCYMKSPHYSPDHAHRSFVLLDQHPLENRIFFASTFHFFADPNEYANLSLSEARNQAGQSWKKYGTITQDQATLRVAVLDEENRPAWIYYFRQDPLTRTLFLMTYWGISGISFCELTLNPDQT